MDVWKYEIMSRVEQVNTRNIFHISAHNVLFFMQISNKRQVSCDKLVGVHILILFINKLSVLRRQSRDTNRNIKRSVYCQYG